MAGGGPPTATQPRFLHPKANSALLWGVLTFCFCAILAPVAWKKANDVRTSYNSRPGAYSGKARILVGMWCGILGTAYLVAFIAGAVLVSLGVFDA